MGGEKKLFENVNALDRKLLIDFYKCTSPRWLRIIIYTISSGGYLLVLSDLSDIVQGLSPGIYGTVGFDITMALFYTLVLLLPAISVRINTYRALKRWAGITTAVRVYSEKLVVTSSTGAETSAHNEEKETVAKYGEIQKILPGKAGMYIKFKPGYYVTIKKDAFTLGDYGQFVAFLRLKLADRPKILGRRLMNR